MIAKIKPAEAWACNYCFRLYPKNKHGKALARKCCTCPSCGDVGMNRYIGGPTRDCVKCSFAKSFLSAASSALEATTWFHGIKEKGIKLGFVDPATGTLKEGIIMLKAGDDVVTIRDSSGSTKYPVKFVTGPRRVLIDMGEGTLVGADFTDAQGWQLSGDLCSPEETAFIESQPDFGKTEVDIVKDPVEPQ